MPLVEDIITARYSIQGYDDNHVRINETRYTHSLILAPDELISPWPVQSIEQLQPSHVEDIVALNPDVVLLGSGMRQQFPDITVLGAFADHGLGVEIMDTGALCRTFNILVAEDRQVVAAIILSATATG